MAKIIEFGGCKCAIRLSAISAVDIDPSNSKIVRVFIQGVSSPYGYNLNHNSEEDALKTFNDIVGYLRDEV